MNFLRDCALIATNARQTGMLDGHFSGKTVKSAAGARTLVRALENIKKCKAMRFHKIQISADFAAIAP